MSNEDQMTSEQQIRSEALEQAVRIAVRHNATAKGHTTTALKIADVFVDYITTGESSGGRNKR